MDGSPKLWMTQRLCRVVRRDRRFARHGASARDYADPLLGQVENLK